MDSDMIIVVNKGAGAIVAPVHAVSYDQIALVPGRNPISQERWGLIAANPEIQAALSTGTLFILEDAPEPEAPAAETAAPADDEGKD